MKFYKCPLCCNLGFTSKKDLKEHLLKAAASINCPGCYKPFKNVLFLIKHLDECDASNENQDLSGFPTTHMNLDCLPTDNDEDDDVEGYFCTVCDIKIPDVDKHIQQFHCGQEVILQDDDEDSDSSKSPSVQNSYSDRIETKRKLEDVVNGRNVKDKRPKQKTVKEESDETFYCPKCDVSFQSLAEHTSNYHDGGDVFVQDLSIHELFPESRRKNGTFSYFCSCCQKTIVRKTTLVKHLKLNLYSDRTKETGKTSCERSNDYSSDCLHNPFKIKDSMVDGEKLMPGTEYEIEEVKPESYEFDDIGHSIFNT